jgi:integrase
MKGHVRERGKGNWYAVLSAKDQQTGKRKVRFVSLPNAHGKRDAQIECGRLIAAMDDGSDVEPSKLTVEQYLRDRITQWENGKKVGAKTAQRYQELLRDQIAPHIGQIRLQKLKSLDVANWHNTLTASGRKDGKGLNAITVGHAHRLLSKALKEAVRFNFVLRNVAATESPPKVNREEVQIVGGDRLDEMLEKLKGNAIYPKAIVSLFCGLRRGEVLALRWRHVDLDSKILQVREALEQTKAHGIRVKAPKSKAGRRDVTMPDIVIETLREQRRAQLELRLRLGIGKLLDDDLLFPTLDGGLPSSVYLTKEWTRAAAQIGTPDIRFHALRHTHASQLIDAGVDVVTISKRLGHSTPNVTLAVYAHMFKVSDDECAAAINASLASRKSIG